MVRIKAEITPKKKFEELKRNARRRNFECSLTLDEFCEIFGQPCVYCGDVGTGVDRVNNSIGYVKDNCVSCCKGCNLMKWKLDVNEFIEKCKKIAKVAKNEN